MNKCAKIAIVIGAVAVVSACAVAYLATQTEFGKDVVKDIKCKLDK